MNKLLISLLTMLLALGLTCSLAEKEAVIYTCGDFEYILLEDGTAEITRYNGSAKLLRIVDVLDGYRVTSIGDSAFSLRTSLTSITIPDSVTSIGDSAFYRCTSLTSITIPDSVTSIGDSAFYWCTSLTSITIPDSVTTIGANPFRGCRDLTTINVSPDQPMLAVIDGVLFEKSTKTLVCYPSGNTDTKYAIPQGIRTIGDSAFSGCRDLSTITIPDSVTSIGNSAFSDCWDLSSVTIPASVTSIGDEVFSECSSLTSINVSLNNPTFESINGVLFNKPAKALICYPRGKDGDYSIPRGIRIIEDYAFSVCSRLTSVTIPGSVTSIGDSAFSECSALTSITIPDSVTSIGKDVFNKCPNLTVTVTRDSYAHQWCKENNIKYIYPDTNDWLLN